MSSKQHMIEKLLDAFDQAPISGDHEQINIWMNRVSFALLSAGMVEDRELWMSALEDTHYSVDDYMGGVNPTIISHAESMRAILLGILDKVKNIENEGELFSMEVFEGTGRSYIEKLAVQANGCYQHGWYDASAVIIRRIVEQLIIDCFEKYGLSTNIEDRNGSYYGLERLISEFLSETSWHIPHLTQKYLPSLKKLKEIGDTAAHGRNIIPEARIEKLSDAIFHTFQGLVEIAYFQPVNK